jgi:hypothetical protein
MPHLTATQREDALTELRELLPMLNEKIAGSTAAAKFNDDNPTAYEPLHLTTAREELVDAYHAIAVAQANYRAAIQRAIDQLEDNR